MNKVAVTCLLSGLVAVPAICQDLPLTTSLHVNSLHPLDPANNVRSPRLESSFHKPLPEEYIWTANDAETQGGKLVYTFPGLLEKTEPHYFRHSFSISSVPVHATLYIAGPRSVKVWINDHRVESVESDTSSPLGMHTFAIPVATFLHPDKNTIAIEAVRGRGVTGFANSSLVRQQTFGQVLVAKILSAEGGVDSGQS